jgi:hypothetical protein
MWLVGELLDLNLVLEGIFNYFLSFSLFLDIIFSIKFSKAFAPFCFGNGFGDVFVNILFYIIE